MHDFVEGFRKEASPVHRLVTRATGFAKKHLALGVGLAAGLGGAAVGAIGGSQIQKTLDRTGQINPHATQEEFRKRQMDRFGSY